MELSRSSFSSSSSMRLPQVSLVTMPSSSALSALTGVRVALCAIVLDTTPVPEATGSWAAWLWVIYPRLVLPRLNKPQLTAVPFDRQRLTFLLNELETP